MTDHITEKKVESEGKVLHLTLKKKWFDMIASGEKKEEYREIKIYWTNRLYPVVSTQPFKRQKRHFDFVEFRNGYSRDARRMILKCEGICTANGKPEWGAVNGPYFVIKLGERIL